MAAHIFILSIWIASYSFCFVSFRFDSDIKMTLRYECRIIFKMRSHTAYTFSGRWATHIGEYTHTQTHTYTEHPICQQKGDSNFDLFALWTYDDAGIWTLNIEHVGTFNISPNQNNISKIHFIRFFVCFFFFILHIFRSFFPIAWSAHADHLQRHTIKNREIFSFRFIFLAPAKRRIADKWNHFALGSVA